MHILYYEDIFLSVRHSVIGKALCKRLSDHVADTRYMVPSAGLIGLLEDTIVHVENGAIVRKDPFETHPHCPKRSFHGLSLV